MKCPDCDGTGRITLLTSVETCKRCEGHGWFYRVTVPDETVALANATQPGTVELPADQLFTNDGVPLPSLPAHEQKGKAVYRGNSVSDFVKLRQETAKAMADDLRFIGIDPTYETRRAGVESCLAILRELSGESGTAAHNVLRYAIEQIEKREFPLMKLEYEELPEDPVLETILDGMRRDQP